MKLLAQKTNLELQARSGLPFSVYTVGTEHQPPITRLQGFSAHQLFLTFAGSGRFRAMGERSWRVLSSGSLLTIPAGCPYECIPSGREPWQIGYVTFTEERSGGLSEWIIGKEPQLWTIRDPALAFPYLERIWDVSGPDYDALTACERLFSFCLFVKGQSERSESPRESFPAGGSGAYAGHILDTAIRFLHDHLNRSITTAELAGYVGYSQRQLTRLFRLKFNTTPLQYLQDYRLRTGDSLLKDNPQLTIAQVAGYIGMSPEYFTRLYPCKALSVPKAACLQS